MRGAVTRRWGFEMEWVKSDDESRGVILLGVGPLWKCKRGSGFAQMKGHSIYIASIQVSSFNLSLMLGKANKKKERKNENRFSRPAAYLLSLTLSSTCRPQKSVPIFGQKPILALV
jgi:hypothetical protein